MKRIKPSKKFLFFLIISTFIIALLSYGEALFFHFFMDDWGYLWAVKFNLQRYLTTWVHHPGSFITFFPWYYIFGSNPYFYNIFGVFLKTFAALSFGIVVLALLKTKRAFFLASLLYASYFGGL